ncbi:MAG: alpha/beta hydrolase [Pseudomonadota bacterium]|nr:alpha/beta hydrolase [Pseudomonadota bacterium]
MTQVFICHGVPGGDAERQLLACANPDVEIVDLNIFEHPPEDVARALAVAVPAHETAQGDIHLVGFSIGAMAALQIAARCPDKVSRVTLISPAAPLQLGDFLPDMAGKVVFELAAHKPKVLALLTSVQAVIVRAAPALLIKALFAKSTAAELDLLKDADFQGAMKRVLKRSFGEYRSSYLAYLKAYVLDWRSVLPQVHCRVDIWHGTADTWSPITMAYALRENITTECTVHEVPDGGHYSTLLQVRL